MFLNMAAKIVVFTLLLSICKVKSQSFGCSPNFQSPSSSKGQSSFGCGQSQPQQTFQFQPSCNNGVKASPQLQIGQSSFGCGQSQPQQTFQFQPSSNNGVKASPQLQIVPSQSCNLQLQPLSQLQMPSSCGQCAQPQPSNCNPSVIAAPCSTITIPPTACTTIIDNSLCNSLANALQMLIAYEFMNSAISKDCPMPVIENCVPGFDFSSFVNNLKANEVQESPCSSQPYNCVQTAQPQPQNPDWTAVMSYLNSLNGPDPEYDNSCFINSLKQKGKTASQITQQSPQQIPSCNAQYGPCTSDIDSIIKALSAYLGGPCSSSGNVAEVMFPEEIPAQLVCNYGYMPTTVPVVSFSVQPVADSNCNYIPQPC